MRANLQTETRQRLERLGHERALIDKTYLLTGLRKSELASLNALNSLLAAELAQWLADKLSASQAECRSRGEPMPMTLPPHTPVFDVPAGLLRILDRDLRFAGIEKRDARGCTVDIHALRHSFGTHLSRAGVAPRTAQAAMRHSKIDLTMNVYTDPRLLDVASAVETLPDLPVDGDGGAAGTDNRQNHYLKGVNRKSPHHTTYGDAG